MVRQQAVAVERALRVNTAVSYPGFSLALELSLPGSGISAVCGASGAGKSTLLRVLAGLEKTARGSVLFGDCVWQDDARSIFLPPHRRPVACVFQDTRLFPHLSVRDNVLYGQRRAGYGGEPDADVLALFDLGRLLNRLPASLSGGEKNRVAIARALACKPQLLLMDEPLAALDAARKAEIMPYLERLCAHTAVPVLYVSHAADEVARLTDHIVWLDNGALVASGAAQDVLCRLDLPAARTEDAQVFIPASVTAHDERDHLTRLDFQGGHVLVARRDLPLGSRLRIRIRARDVSLARERNERSTITNVIAATVAEISAADTAAHQIVRLDAGGTPLLAHVTSRSLRLLEIRVGEKLWAQVKTVAVAS